jgi:hypothetical protein
MRASAPSYCKYNKENNKQDQQVYVLSPSKNTMKVAARALQKTQEYRRARYTWLRQANVFRFEVGMDEPASAQELECLAQLGSDAPRRLHPHARAPLHSQVAQCREQGDAQEFRHQANVPLVVAHGLDAHAKLVLPVAPAKDLQLFGLHDRV